jgi:ubiquitin-activating enzyme E1
MLPLSTLKRIVVCSTLRNFPYLPIHCIEFAKEKLFEEQFEFGIEQYEKFRTDKPGFFEALAEMGTDEERMNAMKVVKLVAEVQKGGAVDFPACIQLAFEQMVNVFRNTIIGVIAAGDETEKSEGKPYWTGTKRKPNPLEYSPDNPMCLEYLYAAANLYAAVFNAAPCRDRVAFEEQVRRLNLAQPEYQAAGNAAAANAAEDDEVVVDAGAKAALESELQGLDTEVLLKCVPHDFEKDDDDNFHIDYLTIATNLRSWNYNIRETPRSEVKVVAGRIIPALATTTAMVCGLVDIEFCKLVLGLQNLGNSKFLQSNINLATGSEAFSVFNPVRTFLIARVTTASFLRKIYLPMCSTRCRPCPK